MNNDILERLDRLKTSCKDKYEMIEHLHEVYDDQKNKIKDLLKERSPPSVLAGLKLDVAKIQVEIGMSLL